MKNDTFIVRPESLRLFCEKLFSTKSIETREFDRVKYGIGFEIILPIEAFPSILPGSKLSIAQEYVPGDMVHGVNGVSVSLLKPIRLQLISIYAVDPLDSLCLKATLVEQSIKPVE